MIGIIPAGGAAVRMRGIPKWLLPTWHEAGYLLNVLCMRMHDAGCDEIVVGVHPDNRAMMERYAPKGCVIISVEAENMSQTVLATRRWCGDETVVMGMPDTFWEAENVFNGVLPRFGSVAAFCWATRPDQDGKLGMVKVEKDAELYIQRVRQIVDKVPGTGLQQAWGAMMWTPEFWQYISPDDAHLGYSLQRCMAAGEVVQAIPVRGEFWDCGTVEEYTRLMAANSPRLWAENGRNKQANNR